MSGKIIYGDQLTFITDGRTKNIFVDVAARQKRRKKMINFDVL